MSILSKIKFHLYKYIYHIVNVLQVVFCKKIIVLTKEDSLNTLLNTNYSISRFGDGEIRLVNGEKIVFQEYDPILTARLREILTSDLENHKVCISGVFHSLSLYTREEKYFWRKHLFYYRKIWQKYLRPGTKHLNTFITRPYMPYLKEYSPEKHFKKFKLLWDKKNILIIEGEQTRFGINNSLLDNSGDIKRILCPSENAFKKYETILNKTIQNYDNRIVLVALGPTASVLCFDLAMKGIRAIDIGHLDIEYEWFLLKTDKKVKVADKYTNEAMYDKSMTENCDNIQYRNQILEIIE